MARLIKPYNENYVRKEEMPRMVANDRNKTYIDRFVSMHYGELARKFQPWRNIINGEGMGAMDKLNEVFLAIYIDPVLSFKSWKQAETYLTGRFTEKYLRPVMVKPMKNEEEKELDEEEEDNQFY